MQLILMRGPFSRISTISISATQLALVVGGLVLSALAFTTAGLFLAAYYGEDIPVVQEVVYARQLERHNAVADTSTPLDAMAIRIAEMRAQLARLDAISTRLMKTNGMDSKVLKTAQIGQGGLQQDNEKSLNFREVKAALKEVAQQIEKQADVYSIIDADLQTARVRIQSIPNESPLIDTIAVSNFGTRIDPITGRRSLHEGIDFIAPVGTPILAAASGVVVTASFHPGYGNMIEIEHDSKTTTRYAHASKLLVKQGDIVRLGQKIALVGNTGRSTGPHLHFEVRVAGVAKNPQEFLAKNGLPRPGPSTVTALNGILSDNTIKPLE
ncbi:MAG TPA: M23 family metallopeptidase [Limnobacter sp.]|uniref:M23 family metallopeptidase n=1 Tax=Limnobacter sp. TaxID=2003368 RepID=UPI002ED9621A